MDSRKYMDSVLLLEFHVNSGTNTHFLSGGVQKLWSHTQNLNSVMLKINSDSSMNFTNSSKFATFVNQLSTRKEF